MKPWQKCQGLYWEETTRPQHWSRRVSALTVFGEALTRRLPSDSPPALWCICYPRALTRDGLPADSREKTRLCDWLWWSFGRRFHNSDAVFVSYLLQKWPAFVIVCIGYCCSIIYLFSFIVWLIIVRVPAMRLWYVTQLVLFICCVVARPCVNISALVSAAYSPFGV